MARWGSKVERSMGLGLAGAGDPEGGGAEAGLEKSRRCLGAKRAGRSWWWAGSGGRTEGRAVRRAGDSESPDQTTSPAARHPPPPQPSRFSLPLTVPLCPALQPTPRPHLLVASEPGFLK